MITCKYCNETKQEEEFSTTCMCKECKNKKERERYEEIKNNKQYKYKNEKYRIENREKILKYQKMWYEERGRQQKGHKSMCENKLCSQYLGIVIAERLCKHLFKHVEVMPRNHTGFDFICNKDMKIDVKSACITLCHGYPRWRFNIKKNQVADYFLCVAFDNRENLKPQHVWLIPGNKLNEKPTFEVYMSKIKNWNQFEEMTHMSINDIKICCENLKKNDITFSEAVKSSEVAQ